MNSARPGKVALLTTRHPDYDSERQRIVFGAFEIVKVSNNDGEESWVKGEPDSAIRIPQEAALSLPYWRFKTYPRSDRPDWGSRLFRYVSDQEVSNFLHALHPVLRSAQDRVVVEHLFGCCGNLPRDIKWENADVEIPGVESKLKYGPGGEGERHRRLKEFIKDNPEVLRLGPGTGDVEQRFVTGDRVDVVVELTNGEACVVEIEVEGRSTEIGAHQALKYRALLAGERDNPNEPEPHAFLVAYSIPEDVKDFCNRHGVTALEVQPG